MDYFAHHMLTHIVEPNQMLALFGFMLVAVLITILFARRSSHEG